ncbi:MAG: bifunctional diguanylate cyclase/phosphodiesterase [Ilumatobacteraceae bacterium]|nr:bifunctional diguanylate cyclase/phosphodiesterase [Ilumatobacteraceae bacterium]
MTHDEVEHTRPNAGAVVRVRPDVQVAAITLGMLAVAVGLYALLSDPRDATVDTGWWAIVSVAVAFGAFEYSVFNVVFRRHGIAFSMSEIPMAIALVFVSPAAALIARLSVSVIVLLTKRRNRGVKLAFNTVLLVLDLMLTYTLFRALVSWWGDGPVGLICGAVLAPVVTALATSVLISTAISRYEGDLRERVVAEISGTWWLYPVTSVLGAMTLALALIEPVLVVFAVLPTVGIWYVLNNFGVLNQSLRDLRTLHGFAGRVGRTLDPHQIGEVAVAELFQDLRATGVAIVRFTDDGAVVHQRGQVPVDLPTSGDDDRWVELISEPAAQVVSPSAARRLGASGAETPLLVAGMSDAGAVFGAIVVFVQWNTGEEFGDAAIVRLTSMSEQLSSSLRKGVLHERLEWEARHDALTGLPGRTLFERYVSDAAQSPKTGVWAVMMLDLDRFKEVNDTLGHHAGDALLVEFSRRMTAVLGPRDVLARLAGDEFAVLCRRATSDEIFDLAQTCVTEGGRPVTLDGLEIVVTVSVGVAEIIERDGEATKPMRRADIAMYNAKWQRTGVEMYRDEIDRRTPARLSMLGDLRTAIETDQLTVVYQPKLNLATGRVVGAEALVRWDHPIRGTVPPAEFVRVAEDTGLIKQLTDIVLASGIRMLAEIQRAGLDVDVSVNVSTHDLFDARLPDRVRGYLGSHHVDPSRLTLEITESSLFVDAPRTRATIDGLYEVGLRMAVDDFGTGYSSLSYLRRLPVHELKIDQSFVARMLVDPQDEVIVRSTIDLGHNLGLAVVAEGVESFDVLDRLREFGCDVAQGYAISEPMHADDLVDWLQGVSTRAWQSAAD